MKRVLFLAATIVGPSIGAACCGVGGGGLPVAFTGQTNLVVWDAVHHVEHFVRDARFSTQSKDLGFIAPTPGRPTLSETDAEIFRILEALGPRKPPMRAMKSKGIDTAATAGTVEVLEVKDVAGYRASVLKANDPEALTDWLGKNGYPAPRFLPKWAAPYIERGWTFTAFKVKGGVGAATGPIRMSFSTDRPFNPYSVPEENGRGGRVPLRLYYLSSGEEVPKIGGKEAWRTAEWSADVGRATSDRIARRLRLETGAMPPNARVSSYLDGEFGRSGLDDLYFVPEPSSNRATLLGGAGIVALGIVLLRRRQARPTAS